MVPSKRASRLKKWFKKHFRNQKHDDKAKTHLSQSSSPLQRSNVQTSNTHQPRTENRQLLPPQLNQRPAPSNPAFVPVHGWDHDWDKPLGLRTGSDRGIWRTASQRLQVRHVNSINRMKADQQVKRTEEAEALQMRSMRSIEELAEENRQASFEFQGRWWLLLTGQVLWILYTMRVVCRVGWLIYCVCIGIAAQLAAESQRSVAQEVPPSRYTQRAPASQARYRRT